MNASLLKDTIGLLEQFEAQREGNGKYPGDVQGFKRWVADNLANERAEIEPEWEGKENGRSAESIISTLLVHMIRYAKSYSRSAIAGSGFSSQEDFIYLINLKAFGPMAKTELIKKNIHEKPAGMQIINRLINQGWVKQEDSQTDKRSKIIHITQQGLEALEGQMDNIRDATKIVTGDLTHCEKMELIRLLQKLNRFHHPIYVENIDSSKLLHRVKTDYLPGKK